MRPIRTSVVIPSYNRHDRLAACLSALADLAADAFEVVVVDDGSDTPLESVCRAFEDRLDLRWIRQPNAGPARARNRGVAEARGEIVVFTDDDCRPAPGWIEALSGTLRTEPEALVGGVTRNALANDIFADTSQDIVAFMYGFAARAGGPDFFTSNNMACRRAVFQELGGFDETFPLAGGEDQDIGLRWKASGRPLVLVEDALVDHHHAMTLASFFRQHCNYGRGARQLHSRLSSRQDGTRRFRGSSFYAELLAYPLRNRRPRALTKSALIVTSQLATAVGYADEVLRSRRAGDRPR